jgi:RHS repeat-associated protein
MNAKITRSHSSRGNFVARNLVLAGLPGTLVAAAIGWQAIGATLESQWRNLPEITTKPEAVAGPANATVSGGNNWSQTVQNPGTVPVEFFGRFKADGDVTITLAGKSVSFSDDDSGDFYDTDAAVVNLKTYQTYPVTLSGAYVYEAQAILTPRELNVLFSTQTIASPPSRQYSIYFLNKGTGRWEKACGSNVPIWMIDDWQPMNETFLIQVRPNLGARPVTKPGQRAVAADDQADDAWTRDEPAVDAQSAPGDDSPVQLSSAKMGDPNSARFTWSVSLGRLWSGAGAGRIRFDESGLSANVYSPTVLSYAARSSDTNELAVVMDLDDTNCLSQINAPQALANIDPLYGPALLTNSDLIDLSSLRQKLIDPHDLNSGFLWSRFSTNAQQVLTNTNSTVQQIQSTLLGELNPILQGPSIFNDLNFDVVPLSGRTRRMLLLNSLMVDGIDGLQGEALVRLNRFVLEDAFPQEIARLRSTSFDVAFYTPAMVGPLDDLGFFTLQPSASSFVTWRIGLPDGVTNQWRLQEIRNATTNTTLLAYGPGAGLWTLTRGAGTDARVETRTIVTNSVSGTNFCTETQEVKNGTGILSDRTTEVYQGFDWGYELATVTNDPGGADLVTQFTFNTSTNDGDLHTYGKIQSIRYPDGYWEARAYFDEDPYEPFGALARIVQPWKNTAFGSTERECLVSQYKYTLDWDGVVVPGTYELRKFHDDDGSGPPNPYEEYDIADVVYQEDSWIITDPCADSQDMVHERRQVGSIDGYGDMQDATTYNGTSGRLAGLVYSKIADAHRIDAYDYEFGAWDPATRSFTLASQQAPHDHDMRQTIFHGVDYNLGDCFVTGPSGYSIEPVGMVPYQALKEVRVISGGNLVAKEVWLYLDNIVNFSLIERVIYVRDCLGHATNVFRIDPFTEQQRVIYQADWRGAKPWPADLKLGETEENGITSTNSYDCLKRLKTTTKLPAAGQSALVTTVCYDAASRILTNKSTGGSLSQTTVNHYDLAGRLTNATSPQGLTTSYAYADVPGWGRRTSITYSSGATRVTQNYLDRRVASITGSAVTNQFFDYTLLNDTCTSPDIYMPQNLTTVTLGSSNSMRWSATATDHAYHLVEERKPAFRSVNLLYKTYELAYSAAGIAPAGQPYGVRTTGLDANYKYSPGFGIQYAYDFYGHLTGERHSRPDGEFIICGFLGWEFTGSERISTYTNFYEIDQNTWFHTTEQWSYPRDNDGTPSLVERTRERLTGFASNEVSETQKYDADTNRTTVKVAVDLSNKRVTTVTTVAQSSLCATQVVLNGLLQTESTPTVAQPTTHYYDTLEREIGVRDPLGNVSGTRYDSATGQVAANIDPQGLVTCLEYYPAGGTNAGLLKCQTGPTGKKSYYDYNGWGRLTYTWGDVPYPEKRQYNEFGDQVTLTTYRSGNSWTGPAWPGNTGTGDVTHWYFDEPTGLLTNKTDATSHAVTFDYYDNYYPKSRTWARGITSTNLYGPNGDLVHMDYSDGSSVSFTNEVVSWLNRLGKPAAVLDATGTNYLTYDHASRLLSTYCADGLLAGVTVTNHFGPVYGRDTLAVQYSTTPLLQHSFFYDAFGRMSVVSNGTGSATYGYWPNSDLLQTTTSRSNNTVALITTRTWETGPRLRSIVNTAGGVVVTSHAYHYDWLDRRIQATLEDGSIWNYGYNDRNELIAAHRFWSDWSPVAGQQYGYDYDSIGNRQDASSGGDANGSNLRTTLYGANTLNQYTCITNPGYASIIGVALATNGVTVNSGAADRKGEYFHNEITVANGSGPLWQTVTVNSGGCTTNAGCALPAGSQGLSYDADGNLTFDGIWTYEWDGENRLIAMTMTNNVASLAATNRLRLEFAYDHKGQRVQKVVKSWNGSAFGSVVTTKFVYDDWNLIAILDSGSALLQSFLWGNDITGTEDGAGGIGGLVAVSDERTINNQPSVHFVCYDGNGNVQALINAASQSISARYEYSPFGEPLRATGPLAGANPFRWSTKFWDDESGLVCYSERYYSPSLGRWISRDSADEQGGLNLYAFVGNNSINHFDALGMCDDDWDLDVRLAIAAQGSGMFATYAYDADVQARHLEIMADAKEDVTEMGKAMAECVGMYVGGGIAGKLIGKGVGLAGRQVARVLPKVRMALVRQLGREGEEAAGLFGPKKRIQIPGTSRFRVPDRLTDEVLTEVKNVKKLPYTRQLRDYAAYCKANPPLKFVLWVRRSTKLSGPLEQAKNSGEIIIKYLGP